MKRFTVTLRLINPSWYLGNNKIHTEDHKGQTGQLQVPFGPPEGNNREVLGEFTKDLPKKYKGGNESVTGVASWRKETQYIYIETIAEMVDQVNLTGLMSAGSTDLKDEWSLS